MEKKLTKWQMRYRRYAEDYKTRAREYNDRMKAAVYDLLGRKCVECGMEDVRALQIDHVSGSGCQDRKKSRSNYYKHVLQGILSSPGKYQVLCANCNWIKRSILKENRK